MMDRETALRRIQKCLNLSKSSEPHEAARALAQAQKLMEQFEVDHPELLAVGVTEGMAPSRATPRRTRRHTSCAWRARWPTRSAVP